MIRIGADFSGARKGMQGATAELERFKRSTTRTTTAISGKSGIGGIGAEFKNIGSTVSASLSRIRGAKGIGGVVAELGSLKPVLSSATSGFRSLGVVAGGAGAAIGGTTLAITGLVAVLALATVGVYQASQTAVKFESTIGRLNMQLKGSSKDFMEWARAQGLAKTASAELGATYSVLLSAFGFNNKQLLEETKKITQATRVVASATGRTIEDTLERMRSGLLGNTEAIEDLGIFVGISMIESTKAFKQFANGKSWDQLDFRVQQQIRLAAILEQAYARYGNELQKNVMTKQEMLMGQLKDIKLNLSQAFLPIWDVVLPALTKLATAVADVTERTARFFYWLRGWNYDEATKGTDKQTGAVQDMGDAYQKAGEQAKNALAPFDEINQLGDFGGGSSGGNSGGTGGTGGGGPSSGGNSGPSVPVPSELPPLPKLQLQFEPPSPPDAGAGAVATAVTNTINGLVANTKTTLGGMWADLGEQTGVGRIGQVAEWQGLSSTLTGTVVPTMTTGITSNWSSMWANLNEQNALGNATSIQSWTNLWSQLGLLNSTGNATTTLTWTDLLNKLKALVTTFKSETETAHGSMWQTLNEQTSTNKPVIETSWAEMTANVTGSVSSLKESVTKEWHDTLDTMQTQLNAYRPYLEWGWTLIGLSTLSIIPNLEEARSAWSSALSNMLDTVQQKASSMISQINGVIAAWAAMQSAVSGGAVTPQYAPSPTPIPTPTPAVPSPSASPIVSPGVTDTGRAAWVDNLPVIGNLFAGLDKLRDWTKPLSDAAQPFLVPGGSLAGAGSAASAGGSKIVQFITKFLDDLKGAGVAIPQLATGGIITSPTLAMVGEAGPEAVVPLEDTGFVDAIASAVGNAVMAANQMAGNMQGQGGDIVINVDGVTIARVTYPYYQREQQRIGSTGIIQI
jgi:hypothetical protein